MSKRLRFLTVFALAILALFLVPAVTFAAPAHTENAQKSTTVSLAFTAAVPGTTTAITGGLTIRVRSDNKFNGALHEPGGTLVPVAGTLQSNGTINISFYTPQGKPFILGVGKLNAAGEFVGTFQIKGGPAGIWSALPVADPAGVLALAFTGKVGTTFLSGAIVLNAKTLQGTFNLANGTILPVSANLIKNSYYQIRVNFGNGAIIGFGKATATGFKGPFTVEASGAKGKWVANFFAF